MQLILTFYIYDRTYMNRNVTSEGPYNGKQSNSDGSCSEGTAKTTGCRSTETHFHKTIRKRIGVSGKLSQSKLVFFY